LRGDIDAVANKAECFILGHHMRKVRVDASLLRVAFLRLTQQVATGCLQLAQRR
jgi:hypothetical protein